jgi:hypothetical protein
MNVSDFRPVSHVGNQLRCPTTDKVCLCRDETCPNDCEVVQKLLKKVN